MDEVLKNIMEYIETSITNMSNADCKQLLEDLQVEIDELIDTF